MFTIKTKIILAYSLAFGLLVTAFALIIYQGIADAEIAKLDARLESHADRLQTELEEDYQQPGFPLRSELDSIVTEGLHDVRIRLLTPENKVVFSDSGFEAPSSVLWKSGFGSKPQIISLKWNHRRYRVLQLPVEIENRVQFILQVAGSMHEIEEAKEDLQLLFFTVIPAGLLLAGLIAYFITSLAFKPMMKMVRAAEQISAANLDARLELPRAHDEVHQLGTALNEMIGRIDKTIKGQRQFVADASHELRTPLTIIRGELEAAAASIRKPSVKENITTSLSELDHLSKLVSDLLTLAKLDAERVRLEVSSVRLDELVVDCVQAARGVAKNKGVTLRIYVEEALEIPGDHEKLKSVMFNLLDNAIKYSARRGVVSVSLMSNRKAGTSSIIISDKGIGIPEAEQSKVFGRFYRGSQPRSKSDGSGLGLAIAQRFVELHGGRIALKSKPGKGSTFTVELPLTSNRT